MWDEGKTFPDARRHKLPFFGNMKFENLWDEDVHSHPTMKGLQILRKIIENFRKNITQTNKTPCISIIVFSYLIIR